MFCHEQCVLNICCLFDIVCDEETGADCIDLLCVDVFSGIGIFGSNWLVDRDSEHDGIVLEEHILSYFKLVVVMMKTASKKIPQTTRDFNYFIENMHKKFQKWTIFMPSA